MYVSPCLSISFLARDKVDNIELQSECHSFFPSLLSSFCSLLPFCFFFRCCCFFFFFVIVWSDFRSFRVRVKSKQVTHLLQRSAFFIYTVSINPLICVAIYYRVLRVTSTPRSHELTAVSITFLTGRFLDTIARRELWQNGLDYRHGTGHGIGMFLGVHEGKMRQDNELGYYKNSVTTAPCLFL